MNLKNVPRNTPQPPGSGLSGLAGVPLEFHVERSLEAAVAGSGGSPEWRHRKNAESREILALSRIAPGRLRVDQLDLGDALRAMIYLHAPVPTRQPGSDELTIVPGALLGLRYRKEALLTPQPGASFIQILEPPGVFLAQVPAEPPYCLCLADTLAPNIPCSELILMAYSALTLQTFQFDAADSAGVFNGDAGWRKNAPLHSTPWK